MILTPPSFLISVITNVNMLDRRLSNGPLSASTMSTIRCPNRVDFLKAMSSSPQPPPRTVFRRGAYHRLRTSRVTTERPPSQTPPPNIPDDSDDEPAPAYLNARVLDAMDQLEECPELKAVVIWMDDLRERYGCTLRITDCDLSNGVAMLDALTIIDPSISPPESTLDKAGSAARRNMVRVRAALSVYEWQQTAEDPVPSPPDFDKVEDAGLAGFILLAAAKSSQADQLLGDMHPFEPWVRERLSDVMAQGMRRLGCDAKATLHHERRRREEAEEEAAVLREEVASLRKEANMWRERFEGLQGEMRQRKLQSAEREVSLRGVLCETNGFVKR